MFQESDMQCLCNLCELVHVGMLPLVVVNNSYGELVFQV